MKFLFSCLLLLFATVLRVEACSCMEYGVPPCEEYRRASAVFVGKVRALVNNEIAETLRPGFVTFDVDQIFKGNPGPSVDIGYEFNTSCSSHDFKVGDRWLVYAYPDREGKALQIPPCTGSHKYDEASDVARFLQDLKQGKTGEYVSGRIPDVTAADISVASQKETLRGALDSDGSFRLKVPAAGKYRMKITLPFAAAISYHNPDLVLKMLEQSETRSVFEYEAEVEKGLCRWNQLDFHQIDLLATGAVTGRLLDAERRPVSGFVVNLAKWNIGEGETLEKLETAYPAEDGRFSFATLREGKYVVLINPRDFPSHSVPYPKIFLPGVPRFSDAFVIDVQQGKEANVIDFVLPEKLRTRTVELRLVWPDGRPVLFRNPRQQDHPPGVSLYKLDGGYIDHPEAKRTPRKGTYTLDLYEGFSYIIGAFGGETNDKFGTGFAKVTVNKFLKPVTITLSLTPREAADWLDALKKAN